MSKRFLFILMIIAASFLLGACSQIETISQSADFSQIENAEFYGALQATIAQLQIPVIVVGLVSLLVGWKLGRFGLAINGFVIGGLMLYTWLLGTNWLADDNFRIGLSLLGAIIIGILTYFLYNLMALVIGGAIGSTLMNGAWLQISENVPPQLLVFITTFVSALVMFLIFRIFLVGFSAVIGAAILMLAVPFPTLWAIPVALVGTVIQIVLALLFKDDIFQNIHGDFRAALGQAFGELLGPIGTLRDYQQSKQEKVAEAAKPAKPKKEAAPKPAPSYEAPQAKPAQPSYQPQQAKPAQPSYQPPQPYQAPQAKPVQPTYQPPQPYQAPQANSVQPTSQPPQPKPTVQPQANPPAPIPPTQANPVFRPENYQIVLSTGQNFPLVGNAITVGRNPDNTIVLNDPQVSSYHLMLSIQAEGLVAWDNNSTNGTLLNGLALVGAVKLSTNDVLQVGSVTLRMMRVDFQ